MEETASEEKKRSHGLAVRPWEGLLLGLGAAGIVWFAIQAVHPVFRVPKKFDVPSIGMPTELFVRHRREQDRVDQWHAALYLGGLGLLLSAGIGAREGMVRRSIWPVVSTPLGALGGATGGVLGCMVLEHVRTNIGPAELMHTVEAQLAAAVPLGLAVGLAAGLTTRTVRGALTYPLGGVAGGVLAAVAYSLAIAIVMPETNTDTLLPEKGAARLMWLAMVAGMIGLIVPLSGRRRNQSVAVSLP
jgi:hypothetical protein